jgi:hypothetical protein
MGQMLAPLPFSQNQMELGNKVEFFIYFQSPLPPQLVKFNNFSYVAIYNYRLQIDSGFHSTLDKYRTKRRDDKDDF